MHEVKHYQAVIFDLDGTLYNSRFLIPRVALSNPCKALWMLSDRIVRCKLSGQEFASQQQLLDTQYQLMASRNHTTPEQMKQWYENEYMPSIVDILRNKYHANDWLLPLLDYYRRHGLKIALFSDYSFTHQKLKALDISEDYFDLIVDAVQFGGLKPCKKSFLSVLDMLHVQPQDALMFGDREDTDGAGCRAVGMDFINVKNNDMVAFVANLK